MKRYTLSVDIDAPRDLVVELFDDPDNLPKWQPGLVSWTLVEGERGQPGARAQVVFQSGPRRMEITETVTENALPERMSGQYEWGGNCNTLVNRFAQLEGDRTRWEIECAYTLRTFGMKIRGLLFSKKFRAKHMLFLRAFKAFCEDGTDVRDGSSG